MSTTCSDLEGSLHLYYSTILEYSLFVFKLIKKDEIHRAVKIINDSDLGNPDKSKLFSGLKWLIKQNQESPVIKVEKGIKTVSQTGFRHGIERTLDRASSIRGIIKGRIDGMNEFLIS